MSCTCTENTVQGFTRGLTTSATFGLAGAPCNYVARNRSDMIAAVSLSCRKIILFNSATICFYETLCHVKESFPSFTRYVLFNVELLFFNIL